MLDPPPPSGLPAPVDDEETDRLAARFAARLGGPAEPAARSLTIDRYIHASVRAHGGMGRLFVAYDPGLDRTVAIKALPVGLSPDEPDAELPRREGKALAHIDHPNVVRVFELVEHRGLTCLVLEHVDGLDLGKWLKARARDWREVLPKFLQAGEGLAAVHRAGLVHRDFKPSNVVVGPGDVVKLIDFGLAAGPSSGRADAPDARAGTPRYMAPEQIEGRQVDARADQFSFCVALYEALFGAHPYLSREVAPSVEEGAGEFLDADAELATRRTVLEQIRDGAPRRPERLPPGLPPTVAAALLRGLSRAPQDRFPAMPALLAALRRDPRRTRRRALLGAAGALAFALAVHVGLRPEPCPTLDAEQARVWGGLRGAVAGRLAAFGDGPLQALDDAALAQAQAHVAACDARVRGERQDTDLARDACLHTRQAEFTAVVRQLRDSDDAGLARLVSGLTELPTARSCADPVGLRYSCAEDGASASARARGTAALMAGDLPRAEALAREALRAAEARGAVGSRALAHVLLGRVAHDRGDWAGAERHLLAAEDLAEPSACFAAAAEGYRRLVKLAAFDERIPVARAEQYSRHQEHRIADADVAARADVLGDRGLLVERRLRDLPRAEALQRRAIALRTPDFDRTAGQADSYLNLASVLLDRGALDQARAALRDADLRRAAAVGPHHPDHAKHLRTRGLLELRHGDPAAALAAIDRALEHARDGLGPGAPALGEIHQIRAMVHDRRGDRPAALAAARDAARAFTALPLDDPRRSEGLEDIAVMQIAMEKYAEALALLAEAERQLDAPGVSPRRRGILDFKLAEALSGLERFADAERRARRALERFDEARLPADDDLRAHAALILGEALLGLERWREAAAPLERAAAIWQASGANPERLAWARWGLAKSLCRRPERRAEAPRAADEALRAFAAIELIETAAAAHQDRQRRLAEFCRPR